MTRRLAFCIAVFLLAANIRAWAEVDGDWVMADGSAVVRVEQSERGYSVRIVALLRPKFTVLDESGEVGSPRSDIHNPDSVLRNRLLEGLVIADGLAFDGDQLRGSIYDPGSGRTYSCRITTLDGDYLRVHGYVGIAVLGRTMYWQRLESYRENALAMLQASSSRARE